jgi:nucleotide-binding universal stress UspA family protein
MLKILLAVDGSDSALRATREIIDLAPLYKETPEVELVNVRQQLTIGGLAGIAITRDMVDRYHNEEGEKALAPSRKLLEDAGIRYAAHILVGEPAAEIVDHAKSSGCRMICLGTRGMGRISNLMLGSISTKVLHLAQVPVVLIP